MHTPDTSRAQLWELIKDIRFAMFTSRHSNGHLHSRPMTTQNKAVDEDDRLWFFMSRRGDPVDDLRSEPNVNVSYADPQTQRYVTVTGPARVVDDKEKTRALWSDKNEAWFSGGVEDGDLALVEVQISHAHFWDMKDNKLTQLYKRVKAAATGKPSKDRGESEEVHMR